MPSKLGMLPASPHCRYGKRSMRSNSSFEISGSLKCWTRGAIAVGPVIMNKSGFPEAV